MTRDEREQKIEREVRDIVDYAKKLGITVNKERAYKVVRDRTAEAEEHGLTYEAMLVKHLTRELLSND